MTKRVRDRGTQAPPAKEPVPRIDNTSLLHESGLRIIHFPPDMTRREGSAARKGFTVAYRPHDDKSGGKTVVEISTSLCKRGDTFSKKMGTKTAVENFLKGKTIFVPLNRYTGTDKEGKTYFKRNIVSDLTMLFNI